MARAPFAACGLPCVLDVPASGSDAPGMSHSMTPETASELFRLAREIREREPWKDLADSDWFGIEDPEDGKVSVVSVLGQGGEVFAVQLYLPEEGIGFWNHFLARGEVDPGMMLCNLRMLECEFLDPGEAEREDREFAAAHGAAPGKKGERALPVFQSHLPRYAPWFLDEGEAARLAPALALALRFHAECLDDLGSYYGETLPHRLPEIPLYRLKKGGDPRKAGDWELGRAPFPLAEDPPLSEVPPDDLFTARLSGMPLKDGAAWEVALIYAPAPVQEKEGERPYYPLIALCVDPASEVPPDPVVAHPDECRATLHRQALSRRAEAVGFLPAEVHVATPPAAHYLASLREDLGIRVVLREEEGLPALQEAAGQIVKSVVLRQQMPPEIQAILDGADFDPDNPGADLEAAVGRMLDGPLNFDRPASPPPYAPPKSETRYVFRVDIKGAKPPIWRRVTLPVDATFLDLHYAIQDSMGWSDSRYHYFELNTGYFRTEIQLDLLEPPPAFHPHLDEATTTLQEVIEGKELRHFDYLYDFLDGWEHKVRVEKTIEAPGAGPLPQILKGKGACPPENCGGIEGYYDILEGDPDICEDIDPEDLEAIRSAVFRLEDVEFASPEGRLDPFYEED